MELCTPNIQLLIAQVLNPLIIDGYIDSIQMRSLLDLSSGVSCWQSSHCCSMGGGHGLIKADGAAQPPRKVHLLSLGLFDKWVHLQENMWKMVQQVEKQEMRIWLNVNTDHLLFQVRSLCRVLDQTATDKLFWIMQYVFMPLGGIRPAMQKLVNTCPTYHLFTKSWKSALNIPGSLGGGWKCRCWVKVKW